MEKNLLVSLTPVGSLDVTVPLVGSLGVSAIPVGSFNLSSSNLRPRPPVFSIPREIRGYAPPKNRSRDPCEVA